jgi:hypothetical protein
MQSMSRQAVVKMEVDVNRGVSVLPPPGQAVQVTIDGVPFVVRNDQGKFYAFPGKK